MLNPLFFDRKLEIFDDAVLIRDYHAPRFDRRLQISDIESVRVVDQLTFRTGKHRFWGSQSWGVYLPFHWRRDWRKPALIIRLRKGWIREIVVTLDNGDLVKACHVIRGLQS